MISSPENILVYKPDHIGDVILTTPLFEALRNAYPKSNIIAVVGSWASPVLQNNPHVSSVLHYDSQYVARRVLSPQQIDQNARTLHKLAHLDVGVTINVRDDYGHLLHAYSMANGRGRIVSHIANHKWENLVTDPVEFKQGMHEVEKHLSLLRPLGIRPKGSGPKVYPSQDDLSAAGELLRDVDVNRAVCLFVGGGHRLNYWPIDNYREISSRLKTLGWTAIFVGGPSEQKIVAEAIDFDGAQLNLTARTSLMELAGVFQAVGRVVSNDGGPMHLATAAGGELISIFGSSSSAFYPYGNKHTVLDKKWACSPCPHFTYEGRITCADNLCVQAVTVDEVWNAMKKKWGIGA